MEEIWKPIIGYEGQYEVSNLGNVKTLNYYNRGCEKFLKPRDNTKGYFIVALYKNGIRKYYSLHRLVANTFIPNPDNKPCINHIDEIKTNNIIENLEWCTVKENNIHGSKLERNAKSNREREHLLIGQFDKDNNLIKIYNGLREVSDAGFNSGNVSSCCTGRKYHTYHKGFIWKYLKE